MHSKNCLTFWRCIANLTSPLKQVSLQQINYASNFVTILVYLLHIKDFLLFLLAHALKLQVLAFNLVKFNLHHIVLLLENTRPIKNRNTYEIGTINLVPQSLTGAKRHISKIILDGLKDHLIFFSLKT